MSRTSPLHPVTAARHLGASRLHPADFDPVGPQQTCIDAAGAVMYALAVNRTSQETMLVGLSLADASRVYEAPAPIAQQGVMIGEGATVDCVGAESWY